MPKSPKSEDPQRPSFEEALAQLERIVRALEDGELGLNEALAEYEKGIKLLRQCHDLLEKAERKIELLSGVDAEGKPMCTPYDDTALTLEEKAKRRSKRRSLGPTLFSTSEEEGNREDMDEAGEPS